MAHSAFTLLGLELEDRARAVIGADGGIAAGIAWAPAGVRAPASRPDGDEPGASVDAVAGHAQRGLDRCGVLVGFARILRRPDGRA
jgi:hypothetical protein